jgi:hypothetical protein
MQDREALLSALSLARKALASVDRLPAHPKEEIVELVDEAEIEIKKPKPNDFHDNRAGDSNHGEP